MRGPVSGGHQSFFGRAARSTRSGRYRSFHLGFKFICFISSGTLTGTLLVKCSVTLDNMSVTLGEGITTTNMEETRRTGTGVLPVPGLHHEEPRKCKACFIILSNVNTAHLTSSHCNKCESARSARWVTRESLDQFQLEQNNKFENLEKIQTQILQALSQGPYMAPTKQPVSTFTRSSQLAEALPPGSWQQRNLHSEALPPDVEAHTHAAPLPGELPRNRIERHPRHDNDYDCQQYDDFGSEDYENHFSRSESIAASDLDQSDNRSYCSKVETTTKTYKALFLDQVAKASGVEEEEIISPNDMMGECFRSTKPFKIPVAKGFKLSELQRSTCNSILFAKEPADMQAHDKYINSVGLAINKEDNKFFNPLVLNNEASDFVFLRKEKNIAEKGFYHKKSPLLIEVELDALKMDRCAKVGLKFAAYSQWLAALVKKSIVNAAGDNSALTDPEGDIFKLLDELFEMSQTQLEQFCRGSVLANNVRRRLALEELGLKKKPLEKARRLPTDVEGSTLFGSTTDETGEKKSIGGIIKEWADLTREVNKTAAAFKSNTRQQMPNRPTEQRKRESPRGQQVPEQKRARTDYDQNYENNQNSSRGRSTTPDYFPPPQRGSRYQSFRGTGRGGRKF